MTTSESHAETAGHHPGAGSAGSPSITAEERRRMIREVAYKRFERRGFAHGHDLGDWLIAEAHVDSIISGRSRPEPAETPEPELQQSGGRSSARDEAMKRILKQHPQRDVPKV